MVFPPKILKGYQLTKMIKKVGRSDFQGEQNSSSNVGLLVKNAY